MSFPVYVSSHNWNMNTISFP